MPSKSSPSAFRRASAATLAARLDKTAAPAACLVAGPRQVGKTTLVQQVPAELARPSVFVSADEPALRDAAWLAAQWERARLTATTAGKRGAVPALDDSGIRSVFIEGDLGDRLPRQTATRIEAFLEALA